MFSYEFQKQLVVTAGAAIIYMVAIYALLDFTHTVLKGIYRLVKSGVAKLKGNGYFETQT